MDQAVDFDILLQSIEWTYCSLNFLAKNDSKEIVKALSQFLGKMKEPTHGAFFATDTVTTAFHGSFRFSGHIISHQETAAAELAEGIISIERLLGSKLAERAMQVAFSMTIGTDFFLETAKLRALRALWGKLLEKKGGDPSSPLFIHGWSPTWLNEAYAPHGNMLKSTSASMAAILGGCDSLTVEPEDLSNAMMARAARNVSNVLREESHLSKVADPLAGSYFIEDLTSQLVKQAWNQIESNKTS
jgi:methylmalonyl-CoA mutase